MDYGTTKLPAVGATGLIAASLIGQLYLVASFLLGVVVAAFVIRVFWRRSKSLGHK